jgi:hypothetical protein
MGGRGPKGLDYFTLSDIGAGRHLSHDGQMVLEQRSGDAWVEIARFGSATEAAENLDEHIGEGMEADHLRLRPVVHRRWFMRRRS